MPRHRETEIKLRLSASAARALLRRAGFRVTRRRVKECNTVFDTPDGRLRRHGLLLRLRQAGRRALLTFKAKAEGGRHKSREEFELEILDAPLLALILARLGFAPAFRYEKYRTEYRDPAGAAMLDETPIGDFLELEGDPAWIDGAARRLGFSASDYLTATYATLYREFRRRHPRSPVDMVFASPPRRGAVSRTRGIARVRRR